ncbi:helix-turn-helix transcriptional regulator [Candidatus Pacearchaeota archaeon]|nr:helix-turn-helix transcriptional regulator [Candidatus Pacearchaeota archaeon]
MKKVTKWDLVSYVLASSYRKKVLSALSTPKTPSAISKEISINKTHISRALAELEDKGLIKCLTPNSKKGKIYSIQDLGKETLTEVNKLK